MIEGIKSKVVDEKTILVLLALFTLASANVLRADEIKFGFKNPSFSGVGTSSHYLSLIHI